MTVKQEQLENLLGKIENTVGTDWLEKWVHEIKELEFSAAPIKGYRELSEKVPPLAVIWCMASDEFIMIALMGSVKMTGVLSVAYEIGSNISECERLLGFTEHVKLLKSRDRSVFMQSRYLLAIAAGYHGLGYQPLLANQLSIERQDMQINIICRASDSTDHCNYFSDICTEANLYDKKPTILYVNIPVEPKESSKLLAYYTKHISTIITKYKNISQIILTTGFGIPDKLSQLYYSSSIENENAAIKLSKGFKPYLPGQYIISEDTYGYFCNQ